MFTKLDQVILLGTKCLKIKLKTNYISYVGASSVKEVNHALKNLNKNQNICLMHVIQIIL